MQVIHLGQKELAERWQYDPQACQPCTLNDLSCLAPPRLSIFKHQPILLLSI